MAIKNITNNNRSNKNITYYIIYLFSFLKKDLISSMTVIGFAINIEPITKRDESEKSTCVFDLINKYLRLYITFQ